MIRSLRIRHRRVFTILGLLLPIGLGLGIAARKSVPDATNLPAELNTASRTFEASDWEQSDIFTNTPVYVHTLRQSVQGSRRAIALTAEPGFAKPDLLAYWVPGMSKTTEGLPDNAILLGTFNAPELPLPDAAMKLEGSIILYSLADAEVVDVSRSVRFNASTK